MGYGNLEGAARHAAQLPEFSLIKDVPAYPNEV